MAQAKKVDRLIGVLGARWGTQSEKAFRDALEGHFGVQVINVNEYDDRGEVFGRPDQVELGDVFILPGAAGTGAVLVTAVAPNGGEADWIRTVEVPFMVLNGADE